MIKNKQIIKKIENVTFTWNPTAWNNRGYWFVLTKSGKEGRMASKREVSILGKPSSEQPSTKMSYKTAQETKKKSFGDLIAENIVNGKGIGKSIRSAISQKTVAKITRIKEKFDPMNMAKALGGKFGAALYGKIAGRSQEDMEYFTGIKKKKTARSVGTGIRSAAGSIGGVNPALYSKIGEDDQQKLKKGDGIASVLAKLYNLIKRTNIEEIKRQELNNNLEEPRQEKKKKWHDELIAALTGKPVEGKTASMDSGGFFDGILAKIMEKLESIVETILEAKLLKYLPKFSPIPPVGLAAAGAAAIVLAPAAAAIYEQQKTRENPNAEDRKDTPYARVVRGEAATVGEAAGKNMKKSVNELKISDAERLISKNPNGEPKYTEADIKDITGGLTRKEVEDFVQKSSNKPAPAATATPVAPAATTPATATPVAPAATTPATTPPSAPEIAPEKATPVPSVSSLGEQLQTSTNKNLEAQLNESVGTPQASVINNNSSITSQGEPQVATVGSNAVRNDDPSLLRTQKTSLRTV